MQYTLVPPVPLVGVSRQISQKRPQEVFHAMLGGVVECRVVSMVIPIAKIRVQVLSKLGTALKDLHGGKFIPMLEVFLELRGSAAHGERSRVHHRGLCSSVIGGLVKEIVFPTYIVYNGSKMI